MFGHKTSSDRGLWAVGQYPWKQRNMRQGKRRELRWLYLGVSHSSWLHVEKYKVQVSAIWTRLKHAWNDSAVNPSLPNHTTHWFVTKKKRRHFSFWCLYVTKIQRLGSRAGFGSFRPACPVRWNPRGKLPGFYALRHWKALGVLCRQGQRGSSEQHVCSQRREPNQMLCWLQGLWRGTIRTKSHKKSAENDFLCHLIQISILPYKKTLFLASI